MGFFFKFSVILSLISGVLLAFQSVGTSGFYLCLITLGCSLLVLIGSVIALIHNRRKESI